MRTVLTKPIRKRTARAVLFLIGLIINIGCQQQFDYYQLDGFTMGTTYHITLKTNKNSATLLHNKIAQRLVKINQLMSTYIEDSELSKFNQSLSVECQPVSKETYFVIKNALKVSAETGGKFDVTVAPLIAEWGFDQKTTNDEIPDQESIQRLLKETGYENIELGIGCLLKKIPELSINLSAIAKGYGVDQIARVIETNGISNYLIEIGGETASRGVNSKSILWTLAIEAPSEQRRKIQSIFSPKGMGVATSGDYRNYFEKEGVRYSHTIDPISGKPITHNLVSATVLHKSTMLADAYATAFMVMGEHAALEFAEEKELAIYLLVKNGHGFEERHSTTFNQYLQ